MRKKMWVLLPVVVSAATVLSAPPASAREMASVLATDEICMVDGNAWREGGYIDASASPRTYTHAGNGCEGVGITVYWTDSSGGGRPRTYSRSSFDTRGFLGAGIEMTLSNSTVHGIRVYSHGGSEWKSAYTSSWSSF